MQGLLLDGRVVKVSATYSIGYDTQALVNVKMEKGVWKSHERGFNDLWHPSLDLTASRSN